jgi:hypothetical protein
MKYKILTVLLFLGFEIYGNEIKPIELKNPSTAVGASLAGTLIPSLPLLACMAGRDVDGYAVVGSAVLSLSGFIIGPSAGHFYAGNSARGYTSMGLRTVFTLVGAGAALTGFGSLIHEDYSSAKAGVTLAIASGICILGSAAYDILTCPQSVEKYNQSIRDQGGLYLTPEIDLTNESYGLSLSYRF